MYKVKNSMGVEITLKPRVELYSVRDFMGKEMPGLAIALDEVKSDGTINDSFDMLTTSFGEFISIKNAAYIDINNCTFADQLFEQGIAQSTPLTKSSGFVQYPLWVFNEDFLKEHGGEAYEEYSKSYDSYMNQGDEDIDEDVDESCDFGMKM